MAIESLRGSISWNRRNGSLAYRVRGGLGYDGIRGRNRHLARGHKFELRGYASPFLSGQFGYARQSSLWVAEIFSQTKVLHRPSELTALIRV